MQIKPDHNNGKVARLNCQLEIYDIKSKWQDISEFRAEIHGNKALVKGEVYSSEYAIKNGAPAVIEYIEIATLVSKTWCGVLGGKPSYFIPFSKIDMMLDDHQFNITYNIGDAVTVTYLDLNLHGEVVRIIYDHTNTVFYGVEYALDGEIHRSEFTEKQLSKRQDKHPVKMVGK
jgi:hypothetical protein